MGLYDTIKCKFPLPVPEDRQELTRADFNKIFTFQTKNFGKGMGNYEFMEDGTVWKESFDSTFIPYTQEEFEESKKLNKSLGFPDGFAERGEYKRTNKKWVRYYPEDGVITMYDLYCAGYDDDFCLTNDYWVKYEVEFFNGTLMEVKLLEFKGRDRKKSDEMLDSLFSDMKQKDTLRRRIISSIFKVWRKMTSWIPDSHVIENWIKK